LEAGG
jgi:protein phosphatase PTC2/3